MQLTEDLFLHSGARRRIWKYRATVILDLVLARDWFHMRDKLGGMKDGCVLGINIYSKPTRITNWYHKIKIRVSLQSCKRPQLRSVAMMILVASSSQPLQSVCISQAPLRRMMAWDTMATDNLCRHLYHNSRGIE